MHWVVTSSDRHLFEQSHFVLFEELIPPFTLPQTAERDPSRTHVELKKIAHHKKLAALASDLFGKKTLHYGFDQIVLKLPEGTLASQFSLQGLVGGALVMENGSVMFFSDVAELATLPLKHGLLIGYAQRPVYIHNKQDPHNNSLKALGYNFGDALKESTHPVLIRSRLH